MKKITRRIIAATAAAALAISPAMARRLSPDEALNRALYGTTTGSRSTVRTMAAEPAERSMLQLVHTGPLVTASRAPSYYVYANQMSRSAGSDGFIIASADDRLRPLLAIAESGSFEEASQLENVAWWLSQYEAEIEAVLKTAPETTPLSRGNVYDNYAEWEPIEPIVKTQWGQSYPYNLLAPMIGKQQCLTGCLPTAMAQVIKTIGYYEGKGSRTLTSNNYDADVSFDFAAWKPDFDIMFDTYYNNTDAQKQEVAKLMLACGVATGATYGLTATSASYAVPGIITYMGYDSKSQYISRGGYRSEVWEKIVYDELKTGRPVMYTGTSAGGHAFVCDGYSDNGMFHINWGWMGQSDGYYVLSVLDPSDQGAGASDSGYNFGQGITTFIPPTEAASAPVIPDKPVNQPITVAYQGSLPPSPYCVVNQTTTANDDYQITGIDFRETGSNVGDNPLPFTPGFLLTNTSTGEEKFLPANQKISPEKFSERNTTFQVFIDKNQFTYPSEWTVFMAFSVDGYDGYWPIAPAGGTPKQDHWLMTVSNESKPGDDKAPIIALRFSLADRLNPGVSSSDYATKGIYQQSVNNYVEGLVTNFSGNDFSAKLRFGLENGSGAITYVGDISYLLLRDGETRKLGAYFQTSGNITPGKYKLRLYVTDVGLPFDDNYLDVEVFTGLRPGENEKGYGPDGAEIGFWENGQYTKPYAVSIIKGETFSGTTSVAIYNGQQINYQMVIYNRGNVLTGNPVWSSGLLGSHPSSFGATYQRGDDFSVKPDLPVGNYTMAFRNMTPDTRLLSFPADFSVGIANDGIIYVLNDDGKTLTARNTTTEGSTLTSVTIPETVEGKTVTMIGAELFDGNRKIQEVILPASITKVEANAFRGTTSLRSVTFNSPQPPYAVSASIFYGASSDLEVFVPAEYFATYGDSFRSSGTLCKIATSLKTDGTSSMTLKPGNTRTVNLTVAPDDNVSVKAVSANDRVATASVSGSVLTIKAAGVGETTVTVTAGGGVAAPVEITVKVEPAGSLVTKGDFNGDGHINISDVPLLVEAILRNDTDLKYDVNGDDKVNISDVTAIVTIILNGDK